MEAQVIEFCKERLADFAAVIGVPHDKWEEVKALVVLKPGVHADDRDIMAFVKARKGSLVAPKSVEIILTAKK